MNFKKPQILKVSDINKKDEGECKTGFYITSFLINISLIGLVFAIKNFIPPEVPFFYGLPEGESQLAPWWFLTIPAFLAITFTGINFFICRKNPNDFIKQISTYMLIPINFLSVIAIIRIILLVGSF